MKQDKGNLVISLDFELLWGVFDKVNFKEKEKYFKNSRDTIPEILELFSNYGIAATWATVGMLFNKNWEQWISNIPEPIPEYDINTLSAYNYGIKNKDEIDDYFCFASSIIQEIKKTSKQEIGTHTYSHYYCLEKGQDSKSFLSDLDQNIKMAREAGIELKSLVFPRNQFNKEYLRICHNKGIRTVRSNPNNWYWSNTQKNSLKTKIFRTGDAYIGLQDKSYPIDTLKKINKEPIAQKASRLLRPYSNSFLNTLKIKRIKGEMLFAAKNNLIYHLWWHPHNFGDFPTESLDDLKQILDFYIYCKEHYGMESCSMIDIAERVN